MSITKIAAITGASVSTVARVLRDPEHKCHSMELKEKRLHGKSAMCPTKQQRL